MKIVKKISLVYQDDPHRYKCYWKLLFPNPLRPADDKDHTLGLEHRIDGPAMKDSNGDMGWFYLGKILHIHPDKVSIGDTVIFGFGLILVLKHLEGLVYEVMRGDHKFNIMFEQKKYIETMARRGHDYYDFD